MEEFKEYLKVLSNIFRKYIRPNVPIIGGILGLAGVILAAIFLISGVESVRRNIGPDDQTLISQRDELTVTFIKSDNNSSNLTVEVADTQDERRVGLMNRHFLDYDRGMLFVFPKEEVLEFWMRNTFIPLDIIFVDEDKEIVYIQKNTTPLQESPTYSSIFPSKYAIEVNSGWSDTNNIEVGDTVFF
ncbi:MAG TPA: DUF192 domain-containing protein [Candidatus Dojkabacteria bacterium]|jgi:hypothetical protein